MMNEYNDNFGIDKIDEAFTGEGVLREEPLEANEPNEKVIEPNIVL